MTSMQNCRFDRNDNHGHDARHPHIVTLVTGTTVIGDQSTANTDVIFAGTSADAMPTLQFIGAVNATDTYSVRSITVAGDPWLGGVPAYGTVALEFQAKLEITNGVYVTDGHLNFMPFYGTDVIFDGNSIIDNNSTLNSGGPRGYSAGTQVNGTITLGANGVNQFDTGGEGLIGTGTIRQIGKNDVIGVGYVSSGVHFDIQRGTLAIGGELASFDGTIGPVNGSRGPSLGPSATVKFLGFDVSPTDTQTATFDTSSGLLSLINSKGQDVGHFHFSGNARGLNVSVVPASGFNGGYVTITDHPGAASPIPITFA